MSQRSLVGLSFKMLKLLDQSTLLKLLINYKHFSTTSTVVGSDSTVLIKKPPDRSAEAHGTGGGVRIRPARDQGLFGGSDQP